MDRQLYLRPKGLGFRVLSRLTSTCGQEELSIKQQFDPVILNHSRPTCMSQNSSMAASCPGIKAAKQVQIKSNLQILRHYPWVSFDLLHDYTLCSGCDLFCSLFVGDWLILNWWNPNSLETLL